MSDRVSEAQATVFYESPHESMEKERYARNVLQILIPDSENLKVIEIGRASCRERV